jgi:hypothetical protein
VLLVLFSIFLRFLPQDKGKHKSPVRHQWGGWSRKKLRKYCVHANVSSLDCITAMFALMAETVSTSETSVNFYQTRRPKNPEDSRLQYQTGFLPDEAICRRPSKPAVWSTKRHAYIPKYARNTHVTYVMVCCFSGFLLLPLWRKSQTSRNVGTREKLLITL